MMALGFTGDLRKEDRNKNISCFNYINNDHDDDNNNDKQMS